MLGRIQRNPLLDFDAIDPPSRHGDRWFIFTMLGLCAIGLLMVYSASFLMAGEKFHDPFYLFKNHAVRLGIGMLLFLAAYTADYHRLRGWSGWILILCGILLVAVLFVGTGARRWIFGIQPSEFGRLALVVYMADWCSRHSKRLQDDWQYYLLALGIIFAVVGLVVIEPSFSAASMIAIAGILVLFLAGAQIKHLAYTILATVPMGVIVAIMKPYRVRRLIAFIAWLLGLDSDPLNAGYHTLQSLIAVGSGQLLGVGPGASLQKDKFLPKPWTDFIYSILCEEWGFVGGLLILILFFFIIWRGIKIARKAPDQFGFLLAAGLTCSIGLFVLAHLFVALGMAPVTGLPLPFISYGGSALVTNLTACGLILNISRHAQSPESI